VGAERAPLVHLGRGQVRAGRDAPRQTHKPCRCRPAGSRIGPPAAAIQDEAGEVGDGKLWRLGPIDLDNGVVTVHRTEATPAPDDEQDAVAR
jgi:hypothetical protein